MEARSPLHKLQGAWSLRSLIAMILVIVAGTHRLRAQEGHQLSRGPSQHRLTQNRPRPPDTDSVREQFPGVLIEGEQGWTWSNDREQTFLVRGGAQLKQGESLLRARQMVIWSERTSDPNAPEKLTIYLEGDAQLTGTGRQIAQDKLLVELRSVTDPAWTGRSLLQQSAADEPIFDRAQKARGEMDRTPLQHAQFVVERSSEFGPDAAAIEMLARPAAGRHVTIVPRNFDYPFSFNSFPNHDTVPAEQIIVITGGVNIVMEGAEELIPGVDSVSPGNLIDLTADQIVIWTDQLDPVNPGQGFDLGPNTRFEVYLEGNIIARQGQNVVRAERAYYNTNEERGLLIDAELRSFIPELGGDVRIRADRIRALAGDRFHASNAWVSTSQFGKPGYRLQASDIFLERRIIDPWIGLGNPNIDPITGINTGNTVNWVTAENNTLYIEDVPVFGYPRISGPAEDPHIPIRALTVQQDRIFGTQIRTRWNMAGLLGIDLPKGTVWNLDADYLSDRGPGIGTSGRWRSVLDWGGLPLPITGLGNAYYVHDSGRDNLGRGRRNLEPENDNRGRVMLRNKLFLTGSDWISAELGYVSDRNFLEQYFETEWDRDKDQETLLAYNHQSDNLSGSVLVRGRINDFQDETNWLPRGNLTLLGEPLFGSPLIWSTNNTLGYGQIRPAEAPSHPADIFSPIPFYPDVGGLVAATRHELDLPFNIGPLKVVPYALGEAAFWQEDVTGQQISRLYGSAGIRGSIQFWRHFPDIDSRIFGIRGLTHRMTFDADYSYSQSTKDLADIPQYNEFDDNAQERFRERFLINTFGGVLPPTFDPRNYALRTGAGRSVSAPYYELVDDQQVLRLGWRNRLQTKVGSPDQPRIKDWMSLDLDMSYFPNADRDNFGEDLGILSGRYAWNVGERTTILASALYDLFDTNQQIWNVGLLSQRSERGSLYIGVRQIRGGPLDTELLTASYSYALSSKWISTFGTAYDIANNQNYGQSLTVSRIGADFIWHFGFNYDASKNNFGAGISVEPRFGSYGGSNTQLGSLLGIRNPY